MERSMSLNLNKSIWDDDSETLSQECMHRGNDNSTDITIDFHGEDHNLHTENKQFLFDMNEIHNGEMEPLLSENFWTVNRIDQEMRDLPPIVGCPNELILSQESNTGHDESSMFGRELSDVETKIIAVSFGSTISLDLDKEEGYGESQTPINVTTVSSEDQRGKSPMTYDPPYSPHHELVSETSNNLKRSTILELSPPIIIDLSSADISNSPKCDRPASSQTSESEEWDSHSPVQVSESNASPPTAQFETVIGSDPISPCTKRVDAIEQRRQKRRRVPYPRRALAPRPNVQ